MNMYGRTAPGGDDDVGYLILVADSTVGPNHVSFALMLYVPRARTHIVLLYGLDKVLKAETVGKQFHWVGLHVKFLDVPADGIHVGQAFQALELRAYDPVLNGPEIRGPLQIISKSLPLRSHV